MAQETRPRSDAWLWGSSLAVLLGVLVGLSAFTFYYAEGISYLSDNPRACVNCHVMRGQFDAWNRSTHKAVATCNGCHAPHGFLNKWVSKGINGWNHSWAFTTGNFPYPIRIRDFNVRIVQQNCVKCHETVVSQIHRSEQGQERLCVSCHGNVGHGT